jgi:hypothetical protein
VQLTVIIASTRPGRKGKPIGDWFAERAAAGEVEVTQKGTPVAPPYKRPIRIRPVTSPRTTA